VTLDRSYARHPPQEKSSPFPGSHSLSTIDSSRDMEATRGQREFTRANPVSRSGIVRGLEGESDKCAGFRRFRSIHWNDTSSADGVCPDGAWEIELDDFESRDVRIAQIADVYMPIWLAGTLPERCRISCFPLEFQNVHAESRDGPHVSRLPPQRASQVAAIMRNLCKCYERQTPLELHGHAG
jgi:hypothetical protein